MAHVKNADLAAIREDHALEHGFSSRLERCPKCHALIVHREPIFDHCLVCGGYWPIRGTATGDQIRYERASGNARHLVDASERRTPNGKHPSR